MKKIVLSVVAALAAMSAPALAADMPVKGKKLVPVAAPSPWDIAFGASGTNNYVFRGISQSDNGPSVSAYFEPRYNISPNFQLYAGIAGSSVRLATTPSAEVDFYAGVRPTFGNLALDLGFIYYWYPHETQYGVGGNVYGNGATTLANTDFWEVYGKATYQVTEPFSVGANIYYSPSFLGTKADGTYASGTAKYVLPALGFLSKDIGWFISGEFGHYWLTTAAADGILFAAPYDLPDYSTWNIGLAFTYKVFTLDLRYSDTDLTKEECFALTSDPGASPGGAGIPVGNPAGLKSSWCNPTFMARLSADLTLGALK